MALKWLRDQFKHLKIILWAVVAVFVLLVFVDWGAGRSGGPSASSAAVTVGDVEISEQVFLREVRRTRDRFQQIYGDSWEQVRDQLDLGKRPMEKPLWAGAIDNLGGDYLTWLTRTVGYGGNIASIGLAASPVLNTTVLPFILRAVCLLGINSVETPRDLRRAVWARIGGNLRPQHLDVIGHRTISFDELPGAFQAFVDGKVTGRIVVEIGQAEPDK